jgi:hypothetical protein
MGHYLLVGAGFSPNWGGPLSEEITGSLLGELHDDVTIAAGLRRGPFEEAFAGFHTSPAGPASASQIRFQRAVIDLFSRLNKTFVTMTDFEFNTDVKFSVKHFLARFDAIFSLNQDLLLEIHYMPTFSPFGRWNGVALPGMQGAPPPGHVGPIDWTTVTWRPTPSPPHSLLQPLYKLHGSSNWHTETSEQLLIMGNNKTGAIRSFPVLGTYHDEFAARLSEGNAKLMVIGYSFQDKHINKVIERASRERELGTYLVNPSGRAVLADPKMAEASIPGHPRDIEEIKLIGELRRPLSAVFGGDSFAHGELMRFFS